MFFINNIPIYFNSIASDEIRKWNFNIPTFYEITFSWFPSNLSSICRVAVQIKRVSLNVKHTGAPQGRLTAEPMCECGLAWRPCLLEICRDVIKTYKVTWLVRRRHGIMQKQVWAGCLPAPRKYQHLYHRPLWLCVPMSQLSLPVGVLSGHCVTHIGDLLTGIETRNILRTRNHQARRWLE